MQVIEKCSWVGNLLDPGKKFDQKYTKKYMQSTNYNTTALLPV